MVEAALTHSEFIRLPCEVGPEERQGRPAELSDIAMVLTVERCYPGEIDRALQENTEYDDITIIQFIQDQYSQALVDFGFAQARGLELGLLVRSARHCESKTDDRCSSCLLNGLGQDFGDRIADLKETAASRGLTQEEFWQISRWAADAADMIPEVLGVPHAIEDAIEMRPSA